MKRKTTAFFIAFAVIVAAVLAPVTSALADTTEYVALGADLDSQQRATVLSLLGVSESKLTEDNLVTVTNEDEHRYLGSFLDSSVIGSKALSSCKVVQRENGYGIHVTAHNLTYVTEGMLRNALATAGLKDADVIVAAPMEISGTAALLGVMKAYAKMSGTVVQAEMVEAATKELMTSGELAEIIGDSEKTEQLIAVVKEIVAEKDLTDDDEIRSMIKEVAQQVGVTPSDAEVEMVLGLMKQLSSMDLDAEMLVEQAKAIYKQVEASGIDLSAFGIDDETLAKAAEQAPGLADRFLNWFGSAFDN